MGATLNFVRHVRECLIRTLSSRAVYINWRRWGLVGGFRGPVIGTLSLKANEGGWGVSGCMTVGVSFDKEQVGTLLIRVGAPEAG
eukprot:1159641-Pelagomonas_calceolata.AAC.13